MGINGKIQETSIHTWWDENSEGNLISMRFLNNPITFNNIDAIVIDKLRITGNHVSLLDIGCGRDYRSEEPENTDLEAIGIHFSNASVRSSLSTAIPDALSIQHFVGCGDKLPVESNTFDFVCCGDLSENFRYFKKVMGELSRTLKKDGVFFCDTINRTSISKLIIIKIMQELKETSILDSKIIRNDMLIPPKDLLIFLNEQYLVNPCKYPTPGTNFEFHYFNLREKVRRKNVDDFKQKIYLNPSSESVISHVGNAG